MSYYVRATGANVAAALASLTEALAEVVAAQPVHEADQASALAAAEAFANLLPSDQEGRDVCITLSGSVMTVSGAPQQFTVNVTASLIDSVGNIPLEEGDDSGGGGSGDPDGGG